jgi:hypothetical protein
LNNQNTVILACSIFKRDLEELTRLGLLQLPVQTIDSMFHMNPEQLHQELLKQIAILRETYASILLIYGDCHAYMHDAYNDMNVHRVEGNNCCEIMLGHESYKELRKEGAFIVFDEWASKWEHVFKTQLGFNDKIAPIFMAESHTYILYLDTGLNKVPQKEMDEMSQFFGLPCSTKTIALNFLYASITSALERMKSNESR